MLLHINTFQMYTTQVLNSNLILDPIGMTKNFIPNQYSSGHLILYVDNLLKKYVSFFAVFMGLLCSTL